MKLSYRYSKKTNRISIKVKTNELVEIISPPKTAKTKLDKFVANNVAWINAQLKKIKQRKKFIESDQHLLLFGQKFNKKIINNPSLELGIRIDQDQLVINLPHAKLIFKEIELFVKKTAREYLPKRTQQLKQTMAVKYNQLQLKNQQTLWGSCSRKNNLNLNWRLIHFAPDIIDYVIIHELAHLKHHNHSQHFWNLVGQYDSEFRQHRKWLKQHGVTFV